VKMPSRPASRAQARESSQPHKKTAKDSAARAATAQDSRCVHAAEHREFALSIEAARRSLADTFRRHGFDSAELDARLIIGHALALDHTALAAQARRALATAEAAAIDALARRRLAHEPVARILGRKEFWGLSFKLTPGTFVPRPETETVVAAALAALAGDHAASRALRIADLGTGSGALLLAILSELRGEAFGIGTDISLAALACARDNAVMQHKRVSFIACHYGAAIEGPIDLIVSNPPYIPRREIATLEPEVSAFDPRLALDGGQDGLEGYRAIALDARRLLAPDGILVVELGCGQAAAVISLFTAAGLASSAPRHDLSGIPRALVARPLP
jgi:release factor glutamine methyltransferase